MTGKDEDDLALDPELLAYVDGVLPPEKMAALEARLARDPAAREAVAQWRHFDNMLHDYARQADDLPPNLRLAALERELAAKLRKRRLRAWALGPGLQRIAASVFLFAAGWGGHAFYSNEIAPMASAQPHFVAPTLAGHSSYTLAAFEQAEFAGDELAQALAWMSEQMQQKIDSPKLERLGYRVETARLVRVNDQPMAVFYYRNARDERVTVSLTPREMQQPDYGLRVTDTESGTMAYWSSDRLHYTVVANSGRAGITTLAAAVQE